MSSTREAEAPTGGDDEDLLPPDTEVTSSYIPQRRKKRDDLLLKLIGIVRQNPVLLSIAAILIYVVFGWSSYAYHVVSNRFFGTFVPHEKLLCRDEGMMLYVQRIMWARAKGEIANIIPDEEKNDFYSMSRKHIDREIIEMHKSGVAASSSGDGADVYMATKETKRKTKRIKMRKRNIGCIPTIKLYVELSTKHTKKIQT